MSLRVLSLALVLALAPSGAALGSTLAGYVRDKNWYARYQSNPFGVGYYEFAINANAANASLPGMAAATGIFGEFSGAATGVALYTVASWDVWWRSAYAFNVPVPASGSSPVVDLRLRATMWGYAAFWDDTGYTEFGQTFVASGPISMIYLRLPQFPGSPTYRLTMHEGGPGGAQVGEERTFGAGDQRPIYGYGQMPTVAGRTYYARIRSAIPGIINQMDPRPDYSDPMPGGCLWVGPAGNVQPVPDRDLGLVIMSDDDGLITDMYTRSGGTTLGGSTVGQTFIARGVNLISVALWLGQTPLPNYYVQIRQNGPGGLRVGTVKQGRPARVSADPEMIVAWPPGECPLTPGATYYVEVARTDSALLNNVYANPYNPFAYGEAYANGVAVPGTDLAGTIMEEAATGSVLRATVRLSTDPRVDEADRGTNSLVVRWTTLEASDSKVEFAVDTPPYTRSVYEPAAVTSHALALPGLKPNAMYHYRVSSAAEGYRPAISRDLVICTRAAGTNLLLNPGFESGAASTSSSRPLTNWTATGGVDIKEANGGWFGGLPPHSGNWLLQGAVNGSTSDGYVYQRVAATPEKNYTFSAWVTTWPQENNTWKYDVWHDKGRLIYMRLGIDPFGGINPLSPDVQWTPRMYSHLRYSNLAKTAVARSANITVFISMKGDGVQWHLYGADDCVLTETAVAQPYWANPRVGQDGVFSAELVGDAGVTNLIEVSENLSSWSPLTELVQTNALVPFVDSNATQSTNRYYRALVR